MGEDVLAETFDHLDWSSFEIGLMVDRYWANYCRKYVIPAVEKIYSKLVELEATKNRQINFNDGDCNVWYSPNLAKKVIFHTGQNYNFLIVLDKTSLHVRRYYEAYELAEDTPCGLKQEWKLEDELEMKEKGMLHAILMSGSFVEQYSDDVLDNVYVQRPSKYNFEQTNFEMRYGDSRDSGYVITYNIFGNSTQNTMSNIRMLQAIFDCDIPCILNEIYQEDCHGDNLKKFMQYFGKNV